ncbi:MAG: helix-hairpin-helix domain-containing protein [Burkholderiales bacterium]
MNASQAARLGALPRGGYRPRGKRARQLFILQGLPGVGPQHARRLIDHFGSVEGVVTASTDELSAISGIGRHIAEKIRWAVEGPRRSY